MSQRLLVIFLIIAFANCKKANQGPDVIDPDPMLAITEVGQPTGPTIQKTIGANGGTITSADGKVTLNIPAGALETNQAISVQQIQNKAPLGMHGFAYRFLPHGTQFKKPVMLSLHYNEQDIIGTTPECINLATQLENKTWKKINTITNNTNTKTITAGLNHFSDYSFYTAFRLIDLKTKTDTAIIHLNTTEEVRLDAVEVEEADEGLLVPMLTPLAKEWTINGIVNPPLNNNFGYFGGKNGYTNAQRDYIAPRRKPNPDTVALSAKLDLGSKGVLFLVRTVVINDVNKLSINGKDYPNAVPSALIYDPIGFLALQSIQTFPTNKHANVSLNIQPIFNSAPGTYQFSGSEDVSIIAKDEFGNTWASEKLLPNGTKQYAGHVEITVSGVAPNIFLKGKITGTLFGAAGTTSSAPVEVLFGVVAK